MIDNQNTPKKIASFGVLTNHEEQTLLPLVIGILSHRNQKQKVFSNTRIRKVLKEFGEDIDERQIRALVFHIRNNNLLPLLIANNEGYYIASNIEDVNAWIATQQGKIEAMQLTLSSIKTQMQEQMETLLNGGESHLSGQMSIFDFIS